MTTSYKRHKRLIVCICPTCLGSGTVATTTGREVCAECDGMGNVVRVVVEIVNEA